MLTSKQRARLRAIANGYDTIFQIGKGGISDALVKQVDDALAAREMIKLRVLDNCEFSARIVANELAQADKADVVQVIGTRFVLYRPNPKKPVISELLD